MKYILSSLTVLLVGTSNGYGMKIHEGPYRSGHQNSTAEVVSSAVCDPDYGWIPGVEGSNKCYMVLKSDDVANCYLGGGGGWGYGLSWFDSMACCYSNHGYMAETVSQEEHDLIKSRLKMMDGEGAHTAYWLGGTDSLAEGTWRWVTGQEMTFTKWHENEPNDVNNEDCVAMSSQDDYEWLDLPCLEGYHDDVPHYVVCERKLS